jgi:hypothetical protein
VYWFRYIATLLFALSFAQVCGSYKGVNGSGSGSGSYKGDRNPAALRTGRGDFFERGHGNGT